MLVERYLSHEQSPSAMPANPLAQIALDGRESGLGLKAPWLHSNLLPVGKAQDRWGPVGQFTGHFVPPNAGSMTHSGTVGTPQIPGNARTTESNFDNRLVEQQELLLVGRLKDR